MKNPLQEYMTNRMNDNFSNGIKLNPGPVITVSREAGCTCIKMSKKLAKELNALSSGPTWNVISKEILHETASELKMHPQRIKNVFNVKDRTVFDEVIKAFLSTNYHMERKIKKTIKQVMRKFAVEGHNILIGRGSNIIASGIERSLHVRIEAPLNWRIERMMQIKNMTKDEASYYIKKTEIERKNIRKEIKGRTVNAEDFDLIINSAKFDTDATIKLIICALKTKNII